jgi:hypothetical protein
MTCNLTGTSVLGRAGLCSVGRAGLTTAGEDEAGVDSSFAEADDEVLLLRGVVVFSCLADVVETLEATEEDLPRLGVDFRELGMAAEVDNQSKVTDQQWAKLVVSG